MNVTVTHPISTFTGNVTLQDGAVVLSFTNGTCQQDVPPSSFNAIAAAGLTLTIGAPSPAPPYDANYDVVTQKIVAASDSQTTASLKAAYVAQGIGDPTGEPVAGNGLSYGQETFPRHKATFSFALSSGTVRGAYFTARRTIAVNAIRMTTGSTAAGATPTLCKMGLYSVDSYGRATLLASTANDTTLFAASFTSYVRDLNTSVTLTAGQRYMIAAIVVTAATAPTVAAVTTVGDGRELSAGLAAHRITYSASGQSDLPATVNAYAGTTGSAIYASALHAYSPAASVTYPAAGAWPGGVVCIGFDDGYLSAYQNALPITAAKGWNVNLFPIVEAIGDFSGNYMSEAQLLDARDTKHAYISGHALTFAGHNAGFAGMNAVDLDNEMRANRQWLTERVGAGNGADHFAFPRGLTDAAAKAKSGKFYSTARLIDPNAATGDVYAIPAQPLDQTITLAQAKALVDTAKSSNSLQIFFGHQFGTTTGTAQWITSDFQSLCDYIASQGVAVKAMHEVFHA